MRRKLTYEDYLRFPDDGRRHEIIDGRHYIHDNYSTYDRAIQRIFKTFLKFDAYMHERILMGPRNHVRSLLGLPGSADWAHLIVRRSSRGVPELVVEVWSEERPPFDVQSYFGSGAQEFWGVDAEREAVEVFRRANDRPVRVDIGQTLATPLLPGFQLRIADLFL